MSQMCLFDNTENTEKLKYFQLILIHNLYLFYIFHNYKTFCSKFLMWSSTFGPHVIFTIYTVATKM